MIRDKRRQGMYLKDIAGEQGFSPPSSPSSGSLAAYQHSFLGLETALNMEYKADRVSDWYFKKLTVN